MLSGQETYFRYPNGDETYSVIALYRAGQVHGELKSSDDETLALQYFARGAYPPLESRAQLVLERYADQIFAKRTPS